MGKGSVGVARASYPIRWRQRVSGMETWTVYPTDTKGSDSRRGRGNLLAPWTPAAFGLACIHSKALGSAGPALLPKRPWHRRRGPRMEPEAFVKTALATSKDAHRTTGCSLTLVVAEGGMGNQDPSQIRPRAAWVATGSDTRPPGKAQG